MIREKPAREVGVRELKAHASEILEEVRESQASFVVTHRGRPVGRLVPLGGEPEASGPDAEALWKEFERAGEEVARGWEPGESSLSQLSESRR